MAYPMRSLTRLLAVLVVSMAPAFAQEPAEPGRLSDAPTAEAVPSPQAEPTASLEEGETAEPVALPPQREFVVGVAEDVAGFSAVGPFGLRSGFDVDVALALCERIDARCTLLPLPVEGVYDALNARRVSFAVMGVAPDSLSAGNVLRTTPYLELVQRFVVPRTGRSRRDDGAGVRRAALEGTQQAVYLREKTQAPDRVVIYSNPDGMWIDLAMGRLEAAFSLGLLARREFLMTPLGDDFRFVAASDGLESGPAVSVPVLVRPGEEALRGELDRAIVDFVQSPEYGRLLYRHLDTDLARAPELATGRP